MPSKLSDRITDGSVLNVGDAEVEYVEWPEGYRESWRPEDPSVTRRYACLWGDRKDFKAAILGSADVVAHQIQRVLPHVDPYWEFQYAEAMELVGKVGYPSLLDGSIHMRDPGRYTSSPDTEDPTDGLAVYDVLYREPLYDLLTDEELAAEGGFESGRYTFVRKEPAADYLPLPNGTLKWADDDKAINTQVGITLPKQVIVMTWYMVPPEAYPETTVEAMIGKINDGTFQGRDAGTLMLLAPRIRPYIHASGFLYLDIDYIFDFKRQGHNFFFKPSDGTSGSFKEVKLTADPFEPPFANANFNTLFVPP